MEPDGPDRPAPSVPWYLSAPGGPPGESAGTSAPPAPPRSPSAPDPAAAPSAPVPPPAAPAPSWTAQEASLAPGRSLRRIPAPLLAGAGAVVLLAAGLGGWALFGHSSTGTDPAGARADSRPGAPSTAESAGSSAPDTVPSSTEPPTSSPGVASTTPVSGYGTYTNPRFNYTAYFPAGFTPQNQNADGDGLEWVGGNEGMVSVKAFGRNNVDGYTPDQELAVDGEGLQVTYSHISDDVVTVSGLANAGQTIVYIREVVGPGSIDTLKWTYPAQDKATWDAAVTYTAKAFVAGDVATAH